MLHAALSGISEDSAFGVTVCCARQRRRPAPWAGDRARLTLAGAVVQCAGVEQQAVSVVQLQRRTR